MDMEKREISVHSRLIFGCYLEEIIKILGRREKESYEKASWWVVSRSQKTNTHLEFMGNIK